MFDLTVYPYNRVNSKDLADLPGLYSAAPPRRPARGREKDLLTLLVQYDIHSSVLQGAQPEILNQLSEVYFSTRGTVTTALKAIIDQLNTLLLDRNLKNNQEGNPVIGLFIAAVLHEDTLFLAHCGPVHSFWTSLETAEHFVDFQASGHGLGISHTPTVRYFRQLVQPGDMILLSAQPPENWTTKNLLGSTQLSLSNLRRRLLNQAGDDLCFAMLRFKPGAGIIETINLAFAGNSPEETPHTQAESGRPAVVERKIIDKPAVELPIMAARENQVEKDKPQAIFLSGKRIPPASSPIRSAGKLKINPLQVLSDLFTRSTTPKPTALADEKPVAPVISLSAEPSPVTIPSSSPLPSSLPAESLRTSHSRSESQAYSSKPDSPATGNEAHAVFSLPVKPNQPVPDPLAAQQAAQRKRQAEIKARNLVGSGLSGWRAAYQRINNSFIRLLGAVVPGKAEKNASISTGAMIFIAIAVPLLVAAVGTTAYFQNGNAEQRSLLLTQANALYQQAEIQSDATLKRVNYEAALETLNEAAKLGSTSELIALRESVNDGLDQMDGIRRVDMTLSAAISGDKTNFVRVVSTTNEDLYLLDNQSGSVAHLVYSRPGYQIDNTFICGPNKYGDIIVSPLVDIIAAPDANKFGAVVMGIDAYGNLLYCSRDSQSTTAVSLIAPDAGWGEIKAMQYQNGILNVLDTLSNAVWRYSGLGAEFTEAPRLFFGNEVPNVKTALGLTLYQDDVYILNGDGKLIQCTYNNVNPANTRCQEPYPYNFNLAGQDAQSVDTLNARLTQIITTTPPEPSLFFLDSDDRTIYQFSMGLNFVRKVLPSEDGNGDDLPTGPITSFTVTNARILVLVFENKIFTAELPSY